MIFDSRDSRAQAEQALAPGPPATITESVVSAWNETVTTQLSISDDIQMRDAYQRYLEEIETVTGEQIGNPMDVVAVPRFGVESISRTLMARDRAEQELFDKSQALSEDFPDLIPKSPDDIRAEVAEIRQEVRDERAAVIAREGGLGATAAFLTQTVGAISDPPVLASMGFGAPLSAGLVRGALIEGAAAGLSEIPVQLGVQSGRVQFGEEPSLTEGAFNVATASIGGAVLSPVFMGIGRGIGRAAQAIRGPDIDAYLGRIQSMTGDSPFADVSLLGRAEHVERSSLTLEAVKEGLSPPIPDEPIAPVRRTEVPPRERAFEGPAAKTEDALVTVATTARATELDRIIQEQSARLIADQFAAALERPELFAQLAGELRRPPQRPSVQRLSDFLRREGGVRDFQGELNAIGLTGRSRPGLLNNKSGLTLEEATGKAAEAGFLDARLAHEGPETLEINDLLDALSEDLNERPVVRVDDEEALARFDEGQEAFEGTTRALGAFGIKAKGLTDDELRARIAEVIGDIPTSPGTLRGVGDAEVDVARLDRAETDEDVMLSAMEQEVRDSFEGREDAEVWVETDGEIRKTTAARTLEDLEKDEAFLNEWLECIG